MDVEAMRTEPARLQYKSEAFAVPLGWGIRLRVSDGGALRAGGLGRLPVTWCNGPWHPSFGARAGSATLLRNNDAGLEGKGP